MYSEPDFLKALSPQEEGYVHHTINSFLDLMQKYGPEEIQDLTIIILNSRVSDGT